jgi:hypothetical protein
MQCEIKRLDEQGEGGYFTAVFILSAFIKVVSVGLHTLIIIHRLQRRRQNYNVSTTH